MKIIETKQYKQAQYSNNQMEGHRKFFGNIILKIFVENSGDPELDNQKAREIVSNATTMLNQSGEFDASVGTVDEVVNM